MTKRELQRRVQELKEEKLSRLRWEDVLWLAEPLSTEEQEKLSTYFRSFVPWQKNDAGKPVCICCRSLVRGGLEGALLGGAPGSCTMRWRLAHGECECSICGWPARAYHYDIGAGIEVLRVTLQVHPEEVQC